MQDPVDGIAARHESNAPEVNHDAMNAQAQEAAQARAQRERYAHLSDKLGRPFDPAIHEVNDDGSPAQAKRAPHHLKIRRGIRRDATPGTTTPRGSHVATGGSQGQGGGPGEAGGQSPRAAAVATVGGVQALGMMLGGDEWKFRKDEKYGVDEEFAGIEAFEKYFAAHGITDIPPGVGIAIWAVAYAVPRFTMPKTQTRTVSAYLWLRAKWRKIRGARSNSGNDGIGENDTGDASE